MPCRIQNVSAGPITLPYPMRGILDIGQAIVVSAPKMAVEEAIGPSPLRITEVSARYSIGQADDRYLGWLVDYQQTLSLLPVELYAQSHDGRWTDLLGVFDQATGVGSLTFDQLRNTNHSLYWFRHDQQDRLSMRYQFPHEWQGGLIEPHIHLLLAGATDGNAVYSGEYCWTRVGSGLSIPLLNAWTPFTVTAPLLGAAQWQEAAVSFGSIVPPTAAIGPSANLWLSVMRDGNSLADTYQGAKSNGTGAANLGLVYLDCHYQRSALGTRYPYGNTAP